ncbi:MAG: hypothetical protein LBN95_11005 [Prevotellaceae bacterium]|jgi:N-dimethylarginine dimethylaminohydrolase|nr:hypothetical protein [Prevotellaceae bacterium]
MFGFQPKGCTYIANLGFCLKGKYNLAQCKAQRRVGEKDKYSRALKRTAENSHS